MQIWIISEPGKITMYSHFGWGDYSKRSIMDFKNTAAHEFGHVLGIGDAYGGETGGIEREPAPEWAEPINGLMRDSHTGSVSKQDILGILLAWSRNGYQIFPEASSD